jgi:aubergine-like protein
METFPNQATRPGHCETGSNISILCNFFRFTPTSPKTNLQRYAVSFTPEISFSLSKQRERILFKSRSKVLEHIGKFVFANTIIFSAQTSAEFEVTSKYDDVTYTIRVTPTGEIVSPQEIKHFYNKFFNSVQGILKLVMIGRKFYNPEHPVDLPQHKLTIWPGYANSVGYYEEGCLLNIDISHRCLRTITVYEQIIELKRRNIHDFKQNVAKLLVGACVLTLYNKKCYKVDDIEWDMSPSSSFLKEGQTTDFKQYYTARWGKEIKHDDQPLIKSKVKTMECFLLPEFCVMTGLTDEIRSDFSVMKDLANATKKEPRARLQESVQLVRTIQNTPKSRKEIRDWQLEISAEPIGLNAKVLPAGQVVLTETFSTRCTHSQNSTNGEFFTATLTKN